MIDHTHNPDAVSWVPGSENHRDFPIQNLPFGVFVLEDSSPKIGSAIGDYILDLWAAADVLEIAGESSAIVKAALKNTTLNELFTLPQSARGALRLAIFGILTNQAKQASVEQMLHPAEGCRMLLPLTVRDFTDFYAGIHHARAVGSLLRPENPLLPNYKFVPVGYHGRASSVRVSGTEVVRPSGQIRLPDSDVPIVAPCRRLDYEVELGFWVGGQSELGRPIPIAQARDHIAGVCLLNDWSARDIQAWEYQPLGPFLAKNFATTISPWIVTTEALEPFRVAQPARPSGDPEPLSYLLDANDQRSGAFGIDIEVHIRTLKMREAGLPSEKMGGTVATNLYWTPAQMLAHHTVNGCDLGAGDLLGTGTISGPDDSARGSLMELSSGGTSPIELCDGEARTFLEDGDEITLVGCVRREGFRTIGLGRCSATIVDGTEL